MKKKTLFHLMKKAVMLILVYGITLSFAACGEPNYEDSFSPTYTSAPEPISDEESTSALSEDEKLQKIADNLGYERIEIVEGDAEHTFIWGVKEVENPEAAQTIKEIWDDMADYEVLQYDELDESYQFVEQTLTIDVIQPISPKNFVTVCEASLAVMLHREEFSEFGSITIRTIDSPVGVISAFKAEDGTYGTSFSGDSDIKAKYEASSFFSSLDLTSKLQEEYESTLQGMRDALSPRDESDTEHMPLEDLASAFEAMFTETFDGCEVSCDEAGITIDIWADGVAMWVAMTIAAGGGADTPDWVETKSETLTMAESVRNAMDTAGHKDALLVINVLNDIDQEYTLLSIVNTTIVYDALA